MFDVIRYLDSIGAQYEEKGDNAWTVCPAHPVGKHPLNLNILVRERIGRGAKPKFPGMWNCYSCPRHGGPPQLVELLSGVSYLEACRIVAQFQDTDLLTLDVDEILAPKSVSYPQISPEPERVLTFPPCTQPLWEPGADPAAVNYWTQVRKFGLGDAQQWSVVYANPTLCHSECLEQVRDSAIRAQCFAGRLLLPCIGYGGVLLSWQGRDITGTSDIRYMSLQDRFSIYPIKDTLFGWHLAQGRRQILICEGPMDDVRWGPGAVAKTGMGLGGHQMELLAGSGAEEFIFVCDPPGPKEIQDARLCQSYKTCWEEAVVLRETGARIKIVPMLGKDLADCGYEEAVELVRKAEVVV